MKELAEYTTDEKEKEMLLSMATTTPEGKELYKGWVQDSCRHIASILEDMPSCKPPIGMFVWPVSSHIVLQTDPSGRSERFIKNCGTVP